MWRDLITFASGMKYASLMRNAGLLMALGVALFVGCKKEKEQNGPSLTIVQGTVGENETRPLGRGTLTFSLIAQKGTGKDDADLKEWTFKADIDGSVNTITEPASGSSSRFDTVITYNVQKPQVHTYTFTITDKNGKSASKSFKIIFQFDSYLNKTYYNHPSTAYLIYDHNTGNFQIVDSIGSRRNPDQILFLYYFRADNPRYHSVIAPDVLSNPCYNDTPLEWGRSWGTSTFLCVPPNNVDFNTVTYDGLRDAFNQCVQRDDTIGSCNVGKRLKLDTRDLIAFMQIRSTRDTIYGLIKKESLNSNNGSAILSVKVRRPN